jgi:hypothetical protein
VRITYAGQAACSDGAAFRETVRRKAPELVDAGSDEAAREFVVEVRVRKDGTAEGKVAISEPTGAAITRRLEGDDCAEVTEALAFIVAELGRAVVLEAEGDETVPPPLPPPPAKSDAVVPKPADEKPTVERPEPSRGSRLRWEAGAGLQAVRAPAPDFLAAPLVYVELGFAPDGVSSLFSGRISGLYAKSGTLRGTIGNADIFWITGRAEFCGPRFGSVLAASGCATFDAGALEGTGNRAGEQRTRRVVWLSPGLTLRGHLVVVRTLVVGAEGGVFVPQIRPRFYFTDSGGNRDTVHTVPWVGFRAGLGLGVLFP